MSNQRTLPRIATLPLLALAFHLQAQTAHPLFSATVLMADTSAAARQLASAEQRMRIARLQPNSTSAPLDLSRPLQLHLFDDVQYTVQLKRETHAVLPGLEVWKGRVADPRFAHLQHYRNMVVVLNTRTGRLVANIETDKGFFQVLPTAAAGEYRIRQCLPFGNADCRTVETALQQRRGNGMRSGCLGNCNETDPDGRYVVDIFAGYSTSAAALAVDLPAHAQANIETVNMGLANSLVDEVYLRVVGTGTNANNPGIVTSALDDAWAWFAPEIAATAPDMLVLFQTPTNDPGSAGGWGYMPGRASVGGVEWPTVYRHEAGHNAGGAHCYPDNANFHNGYDNGNWRTHLCGNDVNFYSTPAVNDDQGNPIGNADEADMARTWREVAPTMASYAMHRIPYFAGDACAGSICLPLHWGDPIEYIDHVHFNTLDNQEANPAWTCPDVPGYSDYRDLSTEVFPGELHQLEVSSTASWDESTMRAWIDWNRDGILALNELVMDLSGNGPWSTLVSVPTDAVEGPARMRIRLQYGLDSPADPCGGSGFSSGESEDYTVNIGAAINVGIADASQGRSVYVYPNPARGTLTIAAPDLPAGTVALAFINATGQRVLVQQLRVEPGAQHITANVAHLAPGLYLCELRNAADELWRVRVVKE